MASREGSASRRSVRGGNAHPLILAMFALAFCAVLLAFPEPQSRLLNRILFASIGPLVVFLGFRTAAAPVLDPRTRLAWRLLASAWLLLLAGNVLSLGASLAGSDFGRFAHIAWLAYYPVLFAGLVAFPGTRRSRSERLRFWLDAATVLVGGAMGLWVSVLGPAGSATLSAAPAVTTAVSLAYPLGDLILLFGIAVIALRRRDEPTRGACLLLVAAFASELVGDVAYSVQSLASVTEYQSAGGALSDLAYALSWCLRGLAAHLFLREAARAPASAEASPERAWNPLPYGAVALGYCALLFGFDGAPQFIQRGLLGGMGLLAALVLLRQTVAARDNEDLSAQIATRRTEARFSALVQHASDVILVLGIDGRIRYATPSVRQLLATGPEILTDTPWPQLVHLSDRERSSRLVAQARSRGAPAGVTELRLVHPERGSCHVEAIALDLTADPAVRGVVLTLRGIDERKALEAELHHRAFHDVLTGLPNRALLRDRLAQAHSRAAHHRQPHALIVFGLDGFRELVEQHGHNLGDHLLAAVAHRLIDVLRPVDTAARFGGDEFAVLLEETDSASAQVVAERIAERLAVPIGTDAGQHRLSACFGIASAAPPPAPAPGAADDQTTPGSSVEEALLRHASLALGRAKELGPGSMQVYAPGLSRAAHLRRDAAARLRAAISAGDLELRYQPVVELHSRRIVGAEALARWRDPVRGPVPAAEFIASAEANGLIAALGRWARAAAFREAAAWPSSAAPIQLGINLSALELREPGFVDEVAAALGATQLAASRVVFEITESAIASDLPALLEPIEGLVALGARVGIDDFGTGYSSLSRLQDLPIAVLKLDQSFVRGLALPGDSPLVRGVIQLGLAMRLTVVAEGIETPEQSAALVEFGCAYGQGYWFHHPLPAAELVALLGGAPAAAPDAQSAPVASRI